MQPTELLVATEGDVLHITLNRPAKRNALTRAMLKELLAVLQGLPTTTRLIVLRASGPVFCAVMDLQEMQDNAAQPNSAELWQQDADIYRQVLETLTFAPCPTLCVVQGPALAGGVGLVLACDMVLATEAASFSLPEPKRGIIAAMVLPLLVLRIGQGPASWLLLSGQTLFPEEARRFGLIHQSTSGATLDQDLSAAITAVLTGAPGALSATKQQLLNPVAERLKSDWDSAAQVSAAARTQPEAREGLQAFLERRNPNWL
ncbi:MAG: Enoyl-CoA hydratase/isomerase [Planctomycetaceae bacterium]|nr:Enoyl-CoA hydratase/isomerase [Planctomycetaceae bacterium]